MKIPFARLTRALCALVFLVPSFAACQDGNAHSARDLVGLWAAERDFGPRADGTLTVRRNGERWWATLAGLEAEVEAKDGEIRFELPGEMGSFRGKRGEDGGIAGHFVQSRGTFDNNLYALRVVLEPIGQDAWQGEVRAVSDHLTLYLVARESEDGTVRAFLRNPQRNVGRFIRLGGMRLLPDDGGRDRVEILNSEDDDVELAGTYDRNHDRLSIYFAWQGLTFDFSRVGRDEAPGFYPRASAASTYSYRAPAPAGHGWATGTLASVDIERQTIEALVQSVLDTETDSVSAPYLHALLIARRGKLVLEEYFYGFHREHGHDSRSAGKSWGSLLVGAAIQQGANLKVTDPVLAAFPHFDDLEHVDDRKRALQVRHLLTMSSGLECDDGDSESRGNEGQMQNQDEQPDWYRYTLDLPMVREPGAEGVYCSAGINLLGGVLSHASGDWLPDLFARSMAGPMEIDHYSINLTPLGDAYLGGGIRLLPRDILKLGQLIVDEGAWKGEQIVSAGWIEDSIAPHASVNQPDDYGYAWWRRTYLHGSREVPTYYASGNGGQIVVAVPDLDLVVLFHGGNYADYGTWRMFQDVYVPDFILPAVLGPTSETSD